MDPFLPYFAGFFDGEGSIGVYRNGNTNGRTLRVQVTQNVTPESTVLLREARARWGGALCLMNRTMQRTAWNWQASATAGLQALVEIRPWLRLKAAQADLVIEWWAQRPTGRRRSQGRFLPFSAAEHAMDCRIEERVKEAKYGKGCADTSANATLDGSAGGPSAD